MIDDKTKERLNADPDIQNALEYYELDLLGPPRQRKQYGGVYLSDAQVTASRMILQSPGPWTVFFDDAGVGVYSLPVEAPRKAIADEMLAALHVVLRFIDDDHPEWGSVDCDMATNAAKAAIAKAEGDET